MKQNRATGIRATTGLLFAAIRPYCAGLLVETEQTPVKSALNANETREAAMTLLTLCRSQHRVFLFAGALGLTLLAAPQARAFTIDDQSNAPVGGSARYTDPDSRLTGNGNNGTTIYLSLIHISEPTRRTP